MKRLLISLVLLLIVTSAALAVDPERTRRIGEEFAVKTETPHPVPRTAAGTPAWRDVFHWEDASYIAVHFEKFDLAPGEKVIVRTPDGRYAHSFEGEGKPKSGGTFWATHVPGDTCEVLYYGNSEAPGWGYSIDKFAHGYPAPQHAVESGGDALRTICGEDDGEWAKCYEQTEPEVYQKSKAIARLTINGVFSCTGWLVGCQGHLMTNAHCITNAVDAMNTDYEFMAEGPTCETSCASSGACPGTIEASSGTLIKTGTQVVLDYSLVQLPTNLSTEYGYFRLRASGPVIGERIYLNGHPAGWGKQFHVASDDATDESGFCEIDSLDEPSAPGCSAAGPEQAGYMCDTQSGSSGSPVVAYSDHRVVVLHHCSGCPNTGLPIQQVIADLGPDLPECALSQLDGRVDLDSTAYGCSSTVTISVTDDSLVGAGSQNVTVSSGTEPGGETVTLTEAPASPGTFTGSLSLTSAPPAGGDGLISVGPNDTVTVVYVDLDDGQGGTNIPRMDTAAVDCLAPAISNVAVASVSGDGATITWTTNEPATSEVQYGMASPPAAAETDLTLTTSHSVQVHGLAPCSTYVFSVRSLDAAGNSARDDNGGALYTFTTLSRHTFSRASTDTPVAIPDNTPAGVTSTIQVVDNVALSDLDVEVDITHPYTGDLRLALITPGGTEILLVDMRGSDGDNFTDTVLDDEAETSIAASSAPFTGSFKPERPLSAAEGANAAGAWRLKAADNGPTDFGTLDGWALRLTYSGACGASLVHESTSPSDVCGGSGGGGGNGVVDPGENVVLPVRVRNDGTLAMTGISATLTTGTPGVTVTRSTAAYPDTPSGETALSTAPHFAFTAGTDVPCGATIDFLLSGSSNEGVFSDTFSVKVGAPGQSTNTHVSPDVPRPLPDTLTTTSTVVVTDTEVVRDVEVQLSITHTYDEDLDIFLVGPDGTRVELSTDNGGSSDNFSGTTFDDEAAQSIATGTPPFSGRYRPEGLLSSLDDVPANGTWTLEITDDTLQDPGVLTGWSLILTTGPDVQCDDCAVTAPSASPQLLRWSAGSKTSMEWEAAAGASFYNVYRGVAESLPDLLDADSDSCRRATVASTTTGSVITEEPPAGAILWYLVRGANAGGEGPAGDATAGPRVQDSSGGCP
jgi:subtilisin-like proprotein convertase family protein